VAKEVDIEKVIAKRKMPKGYVAPAPRYHPSQTNHYRMQLRKELREQLAERKRVEAKKQKKS
jgi:hypothetical protein